MEHLIVMLQDEVQYAEKHGSSSVPVPTELAKALVGLLQTLNAKYIADGSPEA
ncbi:MAG TPA: hypothetical protein VF614_15100 [Chthoniobacteraceae bacterium]|jgi:hypothetical protein